MNEKVREKSEKEKGYLRGGKDGSAFKAWKWKWAESSHVACCQGEPGPAGDVQLNDDNNNAGEPGGGDVER